MLRGSFFQHTWIFLSLHVLSNFLVFLAPMLTCSLDTKYKGIKVYIHIISNINEHNRGKLTLKYLDYLMSSIPLSYLKALTLIMDPPSYLSGVYSNLPFVWIRNNTSPSSSGSVHLNVVTNMFLSINLHQRCFSQCGMTDFSMYWVIMKLFRVMLVGSLGRVYWGVTQMKKLSVLDIFCLISPLVPNLANVDICILKFPAI